MSSCAQLLEQVVNQVLEAQVAEHVQAEPYERTEERRGYRNGYKPRQLTTRVGTLACVCPRCVTAPSRPSSSSAINAANRRWSARSWRWW